MPSIFNPFKKEFSEVTEQDLNILKTVAEGWFVEYKREKSSNDAAKKIAKSITSFANSYGGLYFLGIESDKSTNCATRILGVEDFPDIIRNSVASNAQPFPFFETYCIKLSTGKYVLMCVIEGGENPPYVHSDGRIYRRQESSSEPMLENNRYAIDQLYLKAQKHEKELNTFRQIDLRFSKEDALPRLELYINTNPFNHFEIKELRTNDKHHELLNYFSAPYSINDPTGTCSGISGNIPFDTFNTYHNSVLLRQMKGKNLRDNGFSLEIDKYGNAKICFPLTKKNMAQVFHQDPTYKQVVDLYDPDSVNWLKCIDAKDLLAGVIGLVAKFSSFIVSKGYANGLEIMGRLKNCWRSTLYIDSNKFRDYLKECGLPICMKDEQFFPEAPIDFSNEDLKNQNLFKLLSIFSFVAMALGIPPTIASIATIEEIVNCAKRIQPI